MDVGIVLFRHLDAICWDLLEDERSEVSVAVPVMFERFLANGFVGARKGDRVVKKWYVHSQGLANALWYLLISYQIQARPFRLSLGRSDEQQRHFGIPASSRHYPASAFRSRQRTGLEYEYG